MKGERMGKLGELGLFLMGVSAAVLTLTSLMKYSHDWAGDFFHEPIGDMEPFEFDEV